MAIITDMKGRMQAMLIIGAALFVGDACASSIMWTLSEATFNDGGTVSGTFDYNADTNAVSSIDIVTTAGTDSGGETYSMGVFETSEDLTAEAFPLPPYLFLHFTEPLTDAGGTVDLTATEEFLVMQPDGGIVSGYREAVGTASAAVAPELSTSLLFLSGLSMFAWRYRKSIARETTRKN